LLTFVSISLLVALTITVYLAVIGETIFHKIQAVNIAGTIAVLLITVFGFLTNRPEFLDLALVYGLLNVIGTFAVLKFFRFGKLGEEIKDEDQ
tara:strand:- start:444 stop:722 length:279 start_codon:yes stop_codon:yes gene_type:complete